MILKDDRQSWFGFQVGYQPQKIIFHHHNYPPQSIFKSSVRLLKASSVHSVRRLPCVFLLSGAGLRRFSIQIWPHEENLSECPPRFAVRLCTQASLVLWLFAKDIALLKRFSTMERRNCCGRKAIHHHRANQNPHQRWSCSERKPTLHHPSDRGRDQLFSRASGAAALDAICTHSVEIGFYHEFEHDLSRVCEFL